MSSQSGGQYSGPHRSQGCVQRAGLGSSCYWAVVPPTDRPPAQLLMNNAEPVGSTVQGNKTGTRSDQNCVATPVDSAAAVTGCFVASFMALWASGGYIGLNGRIIGTL